MQTLLDDGYQRYSYPSPTLDTTKSPWVLGQVSSRWRSLATSSSELWSTFDINWPEIFNREADLPFIEARLSLQLQRCRDQQLSISWYQGSAPKHILWLLCSKSTQWTNVTIRATRSGFDWLLDYRDRFPNISTLHIRFEIDSGKWGNASPLQREYGHFLGLFRNSSALRRLTVSGDYEAVPHLVLEIPWKQITHFTAVDIASDRSIEESFFEVLPLLDNVEVCFLEMIRLRDVPSTSCMLPCLHTLILRHESYTPEALEKVLVAPSLRILIFNGPFMGPLSSLLGLIDRSSCHLEKVCFDDIHEAFVGDLLDFLGAEQVRGVRVLELTSQTLSIERVHQALHFPPLGDADGVLVPHLHSLVVIDDGYRDYQTQNCKVVDMFASRRNIDRFSLGRVSRLEKFTVRGSGSSFRLLEDLEAAARFEGLCRDGLAYSRILRL